MLRFWLISVALTGLALQACSGPEEAPRVELAVFADASGVTRVTNDLGYSIELSEARVVVENFAFSIAGEAHAASLWQRMASLFVPAVRAHPGHFQSGDITGELRGRFVVNFLPQDESEFGTATLLAGLYKSANFTFTRATLDDGVASDDPLLGHSAWLRGRATKGAAQIDFSVRIDSPVGRELIGIPFEYEVQDASRARLALRLLTQDPLEGDSLFDGLDFAALDADDDGVVELSEDADDAAIASAYLRLRRTFQTHDHFDVQGVPAR